MDIRELINQYLEGETTLSQEQELRDYFSLTPLNEIPEELREYRSIFLYFTEEREAMEQAPVVSIKNRFRRRMIFVAAASIAALLSVGLFFSGRHFMNDNSNILLVVNGERVKDDSLAIKIIDQKFKILQKGILKAENSLKPIDKIEQSFSKVRSLANIDSQEDN